jgi:hypothetical protein
LKQYLIFQGGLCNLDLDLNAILWRHFRLWLFAFWREQEWKFKGTCEGQIVSVTFTFLACIILGFPSHASSCWQRLSWTYSVQRYCTPFENSLIRPCIFVHLGITQKINGDINIKNNIDKVMCTKVFIRLWLLEWIDF